MTWGTVGTIVGAVVGSVVPGVGTSLGAALGGAIGGMVDQASVPTSRLADLSAPRVSHGAPISLLFGHPRVGGNVIWCSPAIPSGTVGGSKGDGGGTETYVRHVLVMLGEGVTGPPTRIWVGGKLVYNRLTTASDESIAASIEDPVIGDVIYYDGADDQLPDPTYALAVGEENAVAYRGKSTVMLKDFACGTGGQLPPSTIEVGGKAASEGGGDNMRRIATQFAQVSQLHEPPTGSLAYIDGAVAYGTVDDLGGGQGVVYTNFSDFRPSVEDYLPPGVDVLGKGYGNGNLALQVFGLHQYVAGFGWGGSGQSGTVLLPFGHHIGGNSIRFSVRDTRIAVGSKLALGSGAGAPFGAPGNQGLVYVCSMTDGTVLWTYDVGGPVEAVALMNSELLFVQAGGSVYEVISGTLDRTLTLPTGGLIVPNANGTTLHGVDAVGAVFKLVGDDWVQDTVLEYTPAPGTTFGHFRCLHAVTSSTAYVLEPYVLTTPDSHLDWVISTNFTGPFFRKLAEAVSYYGPNLWDAEVPPLPGGAIRPRRSPQYSITDIHPFSPPATPIEVFVDIDVEYYFYPFEIPGVGADGAWERWAGPDYTFYQRLIEDPERESFFHHVYRKRLDVELYDLTEPTLQEVVEHLCTRAGLLPVSVDATELATKRVHAFAVTQIGPTSSALELLMSVYRFYCVESGGKLVFRFAGAGSVRDIPHIDLGASWSEPPAMPLPLTRGNPQELPSMESVRYANIDDDYQDGLESSDRLMQSVQSARTVEYAIGLHPDEAKQLAAITQQVAQTALVRIGPVSLGPEHREVEAGDVITLGLAGGGSIQMLTAATDYDRGIITAEGVRYDEADYTSDAVTANAYTPSMTVRRPPDTMAVLIDPPLWSDANDGPGFWVAAKPSRYPWRGYSFQRSATDVGYTEVHRDGRSAVFGVCTTVLPVWDGGGVVDWKSSVTVNVGAGQLSSITRPELLTSRANLALIGDEMLQFQNADLIATGVYKLTGFARHLGGTESVVHAAAETFALLDTSTLTRVPLNMADLGVPTYYRAVTLGRSLDTATPVMFAADMVALKPIPPANLRAIHMPNGDIELTWQRRTRMQSNALRGIVPLGEATEAYAVDVLVGSLPLRRIDTVTSAATYTQAQQTADAVSTGFRFEVRQLGQRDGYPAILEI
jgi:hypothetical protein